MNAAQVRFRLEQRAKARIIDAMHDLLASWFKHGHVLDGWVIAERDAEIVAYVVLPASDALDESLFNRYARADLAKLASLGGSPTVELIGEYPGLERACSCGSWDWLILFTTYLSREPPIRCGRCFQPVPLYRIAPVHDEEHLGILHWQADYKACDTLQMHTGTGERFGERQLFAYDSTLSSRGRQICAEIAGVVNVPVYYYLHKSRGRSRAAEQARRCPSCDGQWALSERLHVFDFKCDHCRLLSNVACNVP